MSDDNEAAMASHLKKTSTRKASRVTRKVGPRVVMTWVSILENYSTARLQLQRAAKNARCATARH